MIKYICDRCGRSKFKEEEGGPDFGFHDLERTEVAVERCPLHSAERKTPRNNEKHELGELCKYCREALRESFGQFVSEFLG